MTGNQLYLRIFLIPHPALPLSSSFPISGRSRASACPAVSLKNHPFRPEHSPRSQFGPMYVHYDNNTHGDLKSLYLPDFLRDASGLWRHDVFEGLVKVTFRALVIIGTGPIFDPQGQTMPAYPIQAFPHSHGILPADLLPFLNLFPAFQDHIYRLCNQKNYYNS